MNNDTKIDELMRDLEDAKNDLTKTEHELMQVIHDTSHDLTLKSARVVELSNRVKSYQAAKGE